MGLKIQMTLAGADAHTDWVAFPAGGLLSLHLHIQSTNYSASAPKFRLEVTNDTSVANAVTKLDEYTLSAANNNGDNPAFFTNVPFVAWRIAYVHGDNSAGTCDIYVNA